MKNAVSKFWMEIIMGSIVVAILLTIIIFFASGVSTGIEDTTNINNFNSFTQTMAKAYREGEETVSGWKLTTGVDNRVYAITYVVPWLATELDNSLLLADEVSKLSIAKCTSGAAQGSDICLCLLRVTYNDWCDDLPFNTVLLDVDDKAPYSDVEAALTRFEKKLIWVLRDSGAVKEIKVKACTLVKTETACVYQSPDGYELPCMLYYNVSGYGPKAVAWLNTQGGAIDNDPLKFEELIMETAKSGSAKGYAVFIKPYRQGGMFGGGETIKCINEGYMCGYGWCGGSNCSRHVPCVLGLSPFTNHCVLKSCTWTGI